MTAKETAIAFGNWLQKSDWQFSKKEGCFDKRAGRLINGRIIETKTTEEVFAIFEVETGLNKQFPICRECVYISACTTDKECYLSKKKK